MGDPTIHTHAGGTNHHHNRSKRRGWNLDDVIVCAFAFLGVGGGVLLPLRFDIPPITVGILLATGLAALAYRFLGGIPDTTISIGVLKLTGSLAALVGIALIINSKLVTQPLTKWTVTGRIEDGVGNPIQPVAIGDFLIEPAMFSDHGGYFKLIVYTKTDSEDKNELPTLYVSHNDLESPPIDLNRVGSSSHGVKITLKGDHEIELSNLKLHPQGGAFNASTGQVAQPVPNP